MPKTVVHGQQIAGGIGVQNFSPTAKSCMILSGPELPANPDGICFFVLTEGDAGLYLYTPTNGWRKIGKIGDAPAINGIQFRYGNGLEWTNDGVTWHPARSDSRGVRYVLAVRRNDKLEAWGTAVKGQDRLGKYWHVATWAAPWSGRNSHTSVSTPDGRIWVFGGVDKTGRRNDVWYSSDGSSWIQATSAASWIARNSHTSVVTPDGRIWVIGGTYTTSLPYDKNDVWYSSNGSTWTQVTSAASWAVRNAHTSVATSDGRIWVLGGYNNGTYYNDVWYSSDGSTWTQATSAASWVARESHTSVVTPDNRIWVMGGNVSGTVKNDIWYSSDGSSWTQAASAASWTGRRNHTSVVTLDGGIWVIGGHSGSTCYNDVWYSSDGSTWTQATSAASWTGRRNHTSVVTSDTRIWVIGGYDGARRNDVWYSSPSPVTKVDLSDYRTEHDRAYEVFKPR